MAEQPQPTSSELLAPLLAVADAAREIPIEKQPRQLQDALAALGVTEGRIVASFFDDDQAAGAANASD